MASEHEWKWAWEAADGSASDATEKSAAPEPRGLSLTADDGRFKEYEKFKGFSFQKIRCNARATPPL